MLYSYTGDGIGTFRPCTVILDNFPAHLMNERRSSVFKGGDADSLNQPLKWLTSELARLRARACLLSEVALARKFDYEQMIGAVYFLRIELPRQIADEAIDILPLLKLRALRGDDLQGIFKRLADGHQRMAVIARHILPRLDALIVAEHPVPASSATSKELLDLGARHRSHLAIVGAVVLPFARLRLRPADLKALSHDLLERRRRDED